MIKFLKITWILSVFVIFSIAIMLDAFRIFDYLFDNYSKKEMVVNGYSYDSTSRGRSVTIEGHIDKEKVYFSRFDEDIDNLRSLYPAIFSEDKKGYVINVLKFKHSHIVMLIDDNELIKWKKEKFWCSIYVFPSLIIIFVNLLNRKK